MNFINMPQKYRFNRIISFILLVFIFTAASLFFTTAQNPAGAQNQTLVITGTGLREDVVINQSDWLNFNNPDFKVHYFSSNNNFDFHKIWKVKGYDVIELLEAGNLKSGDHEISFISSDGLVYTETISSLKSRRYYPEFTGSGQQVNPMVGFYREALFEPNYQGLPTEVNWEDRALTSADLDDLSPRLYIGQKQDNPSDVNQPHFIRELVRIVVGDERPEGEQPVEQRPDGQELHEKDPSTDSGEDTDSETLPESSGSSLNPFVIIVGLVFAAIGVFYYKKKILV